MEGLAEREGTADNDAEGTSFLSGSRAHPTCQCDIQKTHMHDYLLVRPGRRAVEMVVMFDLSTSARVPVHGGGGRQGPALTWIPH